MKAKKAAPLPQRLLFFILALPLIFWPSAFDVFGSPKLVYLAVVVLLVWLAFFASGQKVKLNNSFYLWLLFFLLIMLSSWQSILPLISFFGLRRRLLGAVTFFLSVLLFLAVANQEWPQERIVKVYQWTLAVGLGVNLLGLAQALGLKYPLDLTNQFGQNTVATFGNPNYYGLYLVLIIPLALAFLLSKQASRQLLGALTFFTSLAALLAINSTGAYLGVLAAFAVYSWFKLRHHKFYYPVLVAICLVASAFFLFIWLPREQVNLVSRLFLWGATAQVIGKHLFIGVGPETLRYHLFPYLTSSEIGRGFEDAHNLVLNYAASFGLLGLAVFLLFLGSIIFPRFSLTNSKLKSSWFSESSLPNKKARKEEVIPFLAAAAGYIVAAQVNPEDIGSLPLFWFFLGLIYVLRQYQPGLRSQVKQVAGPKTAPAVPRLFFYPLIIIICLAALVFAVFTFRAELLLLKGSQTVIPGESLVYFKWAHNLVPFQANYSTYGLMKLAPYWGTSEYFNDQLVAISEHAIKANPYEPQSWGVRGWLFKIAGEKTGRKSYFQHAAFNFQRALALDPYDKEAQQMLAQTQKLLSAASSSLNVDR